MQDGSDPVDLLRDLATQYRGRMAALNLHDPNVCTSTVDWRDALENRPAPSDHFRHQLRLKHEGRSVSVRSNDRFVAIDAKEWFGGDVSFSINRPDRVMMTPTYLASRIGAKQWGVFVETGKNVPVVLDQHGIRRTIGALDLGPDESLHVYANGLTVYIRPDSVQRIVDVIAAAVTIANTLASREEPLPNLEDLPKDFSTLVPLLKTWAKTDDEERTDLLSRAPRSRLQDLVTRVAPHFAAINTHLDGFGNGPMPESATALGALAECASEAQLLLGQRTRTKAVPNRRLQPTAARRASRKRVSRRG